METEVLIVGAGPTGLVLALWLNSFGVRVRIIDRTARPGTTSRAMLVVSRTLELYRQLGLDAPVLEQAHKTQAMNIWAGGKHRARVPLGAIGEGLTPYPFLEMFPQDHHEALLVDRLAQVGLAVERRTELLGFEDMGDRVVARLKHDEVEETLTCGYLAGCDGASSFVRKAIGAGFPGGTYPQVFFVADIEGAGPALNGEAHIDLDNFLLVLSYDAHRARLIGLIEDESAANGTDLRFEDVSAPPLEELGLGVDQVKWFSTYRVHHRVADKFRQGRVFLAGDAGHIHSPVGGQGMNTGIGDAINLAWKLAAVLKGQAHEDLLDSYHAERIGFAQRLVETTDRLFTFATADGGVAQVVRSRIAPYLVPLALRVPAATEFMFRTVSQTLISYRDSPVSQGAAGEVHGGDRLPWVKADGVDNFDNVGGDWRMHVYGSADPALAGWCAAAGVPLHRFDWSEMHKDAGLARDGAYLLRPDGYVGAAEAAGGPEPFEAYFARLGIRPTTN